MRTESFKRILLFALVIVSLVLYTRSATYGQENAVFSVSPGEFTVSDVPLTGTPYTIPQIIVVWNGDNVSRTVSITTEIPPENATSPGYEPIPNENWVIPSPSSALISENSYAEVQILLNIPRWENLTWQKWEVWILVERQALPGEIGVLRPIVRMKIETAEEVPLPHAPIYINGNDNFILANGVVGGSGTENDPYIIENWDISAENAHGIRVENTTAHFIIRNCYMHEGGLSYDGIQFDNVKNGSIENNLAENNCFGSIVLVYSDNNLVKNNIVENNYFLGIRLYYSDSNRISNNTVENNGLNGIYFDHSDNNLISGNTMENNYYGILLGYSYNNIISNNNIVWNDYLGIALGGSDNNVISNNIIGNNEFGIPLDSSNNNFILNNIVENNDNGIYLYNSNNNLIYHNNFINNTYQVHDYGSNYWDNGYPSGGNYWSDYTGTDIYWGENQDIPGSDRIGDRPYYISGDNNRDSYPLMEPWSEVIVRGKGTAYSINLAGNPPLKWYTSSPPLMLATKVGSGAVVAVGTATTCRDSRWNTPDNPDPYLDVLLDKAFQWMKPGAKKVLWYEGYGVYNTISTSPVQCGNLKDALEAKGYTLTGDAITPITSGLLSGHDILVIPQLMLGDSETGGDPSLLPDADVQAIKSFVEGGNGLLIMDQSDYLGRNFNNVQNKILKALDVGFFFQDDQVQDDTNKWGGQAYQPIVAVDTTTDIGSAYQSATGKSEIGLYNICSLRIEKDYDIAVMVSPIAQVGKENDVLIYNGTIINIGTKGDNYTLTVSDELGWPLSISENEISLENGESAEVNVMVTVPSGLTQKVANWITLTASGVLGEESENASVRAINMFPTSSPPTPIVNPGVTHFLGPGLPDLTVNLPAVPIITAVGSGYSNDLMPRTPWPLLYSQGEFPPVAAAALVDNGRVVATANSILRDRYFDRSELSNEEVMSLIARWMENWGDPKGDNFLYFVTEAALGTYHLPSIVTKYLGMLGNLGFNVQTQVGGKITSSLLENVSILNIAEILRPLDADELQAVTNFVDAGGGLIIMCQADYGGYSMPDYPNAVLENLNCPIRFQDDEVYDDNSWVIDGPWYPQVYLLDPRGVNPEFDVWLPPLAEIRAVIYPAVDVYAFSGNGARYSRSQLKFDINSIPSESKILSAKLWLYRFAADNWDGEILLNRVDDQPWSENITAAEFDAQALTNEETQASKFMSPGWDYLNVEDQLNADHEAGHAYSSYRLRWANDDGSEPSVGIDDGRFLVIESELDDLCIFFPSSEYGGSDPYLEVVYVPPHAVSVSISPTYKSGKPGEELSYTVMVANMGNLDDNYVLTVSDNSGWALTLGDNLLEVPAGESRQTTLSVIIPAGAENCTRDNITVTAISQADNTVRDNASCIAHAVRVGRIPRGPIYINGDDNFIPANGVTSGSGTENDPYIIENWDISAENANGIWVENTTAYFVVRNCYVHDGWNNGKYGIYLDPVINGIIDNNIVENNDSGIYLEYSDNNIISNNIVRKNLYNGIRLDYSDNNVIYNNTCENNGDDGIELVISNNNSILNDFMKNNVWNGVVLLGSCNNNLISSNAVENNGDYGICLDSSDNNTISGNTVGNNSSDGIYLSGSDNNLISNNVVKNGYNPSIELDYSDNNLLFNNTMENNHGDGIRLHYSDNNFLSNNTLKNNFYDGIDISGSNNIVSNNIMENNTNGIRLDGSNNFLSNNTCSNNNEYGIRLEGLNNTLDNNTCCSNNYYGIFLESSSNNTLSNNIVENNSTGIYLEYSDNNLISNDILGNNLANGIRLDYSHNNIIENNLAENNGDDGIELGESENNFILNNVAENNLYNGVVIWNSDYNIIENNLLENNYYGIDFAYGSENNLVSNNTVENNGYGIHLLVKGNGSNNNRILNNIVKNNSVVGIYIEGSENNLVENNLLENNTPGIQLYSSRSNLISNNIVNNNHGSVYLSESDYNLISNNTIENSYQSGILLADNSHNNLVSNNIMNNNNYGINLDHSGNNLILNNILENNGTSIPLYSSDNNLLTSNIVKNAYVGISLGSSDNNIIENCTVENNTYGISLYDSDNNRISNNTVGNSSDYGIYLDSSNNNLMENNTCENNKGHGIHLVGSDKNILTKNTCLNNGWGDTYYSSGIVLNKSTVNNLSNNFIENSGAYGIFLCNFSINNVIRNNFIENHGYVGIGLSYSSNNLIYHNNFLNNTTQAYDEGSNYWDNGYPSGGNYWSDYTGVDENQGENQNIPGSDGIGDTPYYISGGTNRDRYPLMSPWVAPSPVIGWDALITATFSGGSDDAIFGVRPDATSGFDIAYDIPEPPPPVAPPYVRAYFYYPEQAPDELHLSCLAPENLMEWPLRIEYADNTENITLTWNVENIPSEYNVLLYRGGASVADMRAEDGYTFEAGNDNNDFLVVVGKLMPFTLKLTQGWNMVSFPILLENMNPDSIFSGYYVLYRWDAENKCYVLHADSGGFIEPDPNVEVGVGYWVYVLENEKVALLGFPINQLTLSLCQGWNLIGSPYYDSSIADPADDPGDSVLPWAFTWNAIEKSYDMTQLLEAGKGYWIYTLQECTLTLPAPEVVAGELIAVQSVDANILDVDRTKMDQAMQILALTQDTLMTYDWNMNYIPLLAESWEIGENGLYIDWHLRQDVKFQCGEPFDADAVVYSIGRAKQPWSVQSDTVQNILDAEALDQYTVRVHLKQWDRWLFDWFAQTSSSIVCPVCGEDPAYGVSKFCGTGPFKVTEWVRDTRITLVRNDDYRWGPEIYQNRGPAHLSRITIEIDPNDNTREEKFRSGEANMMIGFSPRPDLIQWLSTAPNVDHNFVYPRSSMVYVGFNVSSLSPEIQQGLKSGRPCPPGHRISPVNDNRPWLQVGDVMIPDNTDRGLLVRKALLYATDKENILLYAWENLGKMAYGPLTSLMWGYDPSVENMFPYDPEMAENLLAQVGYTGGLDLTILTTNYDPYVKTCEVLKEQWAKVGVTLDIEVLDFDDIESIIANDDHDLWIGGYTWPNADMLWYYWDTIRVPPGPNRFWWGNGYTDNMIDNTFSISDAVAFKAIQDGQRLIMEDAVVLPIVMRPFLLAHRVEVKGFKVHPLSNLIWKHLDTYVDE